MTRTNDTVNEMSPAPIGRMGVGAHDAEIRRRVLQEMQRHASLDIERLSIQVGNGVVTLQGEVPNIVELPNLAHAIRAIPAVNELRANLRMRCAAAR